ncbi:MAG: Cd(II)/Pb(II)-responsive transcriptional regulator [Pseudomonadota bacterium]|jgi:Cd(II)/Pb(II)-responsive transcriptional regulator
MTETFQIGQLATKLAVPVETIRYYEREGLLPKPARSNGNYRLYADNERTRLEFILHCRALDMTLQEIRTLLSLRDAPEKGCAEVNALLDEHIGHVTERMRALRRLHTELKSLRAHCEVPSASKDCGILQELASAPIKRRKSVAAGVHAANRGS